MNTQIGFDKIVASLQESYPTTMKNHVGRNVTAAPACLHQATNPAAVTFNDVLYVFVEDTDHKLWFRKLEEKYQGSSWSDCAILELLSAGLAAKVKGETL